MLARIMNEAEHATTTESGDTHPAPGALGYAVWRAQLRALAVVALCALVLPGAAVYWLQPVWRPGAAGRAGDPAHGEAWRRATAWRQVAERHRLAGRPAEAIHGYQQALRCWPQWADGWAGLGLLYLDTGEFERADDAFGRALRADPFHPHWLNDRGVACLQLGRLALAGWYFKAATEQDPAFAPAWFNRSLYERARAQPELADVALAHYFSLRPAHAAPEESDEDGQEGLAFPAIPLHSGGDGAIAVRR